MIRSLTAQDAIALRDVFFNSFSEEEAPITYDVLINMISQETAPASLCLGYVVDGEVKGAVGFTPAYFDQDADMSAYILAPLAVHSAHQSKGIATQLINHAKQTLLEQGVDAILVYGDPNYYGRHGFDAKLGQNFVPPYPLEFEFGWQAMMLTSKAPGEAKFPFTCAPALADETLW